MNQSYRAEQWAARVNTCSEPQQRDRLLGVSFTLTAKLLGVSRSRVHQLVDSGKLVVVDVFDERVRIGHLVTFSSIERRRRTSRPRRTQWRSVRSAGR